MTRPWAALGLSLAVSVASCAESPRPPPPKDTTVGTTQMTAPDGSTSLFDDLSALNLCSETVVELEFTRPNLYMILDRSGSMDESIPNPFPQTRYGAARAAIENVLSDVGHRVRFGVATFPADSQSGCKAGSEVFETREGDPVSFALSGEKGPVLEGLSKSMAAISPRGGTPTAATLRALEETLLDLRGKTYVFLLTDGAPNCNPLAECNIDRCLANIEAWPTPDGDCDQTTNCCGLYYDGSACLDDRETQTALGALADAGILTFVIGIPGAEVYTEVLDDMAVAGGTARETERKYYQASDADELVETLSELGNEVSLSCDIALAEPPPDPDKVNVFFDDTPIYFSDTDGWSWDGEEAVRIVGPACDLLEAGDVLQVRIVGGCPTILR